jgi:hypothetical protein
MMAENIRYWMEAGGYGPGFTAGMCERGDEQVPLRRNVRLFGDSNCGPPISGELTDPIKKSDFCNHFSAQAIP